MRVKPIRIITAILVAVFLVLWVVLELPCVFRLITGIPCPMCGMSRAWLAALRLDLDTAFSCHGLFWYVPVFLILCLTGGKLTGHTRADRILTGALVGTFLLYYIIRLVLFFNGDPL